jgi:outer membrane murein-binding lipoprotein Lpp
MKKSILILIAALLAPFTFSGCALLSKTSTTEQKASDVQKLAHVAALAGTQAALLQNPEYRPAFETALASLDTAVQAKAINGIVLRQILASLPIKELKSDEARIAIVSATMLYDLTVGDTMNVEMPAYVLAAATGIRDGLRDGLLVSGSAFKLSK